MKKAIFSVQPPEMVISKYFSVPTGARDIGSVNSRTLNQLNNLQLISYLANNRLECLSCFQFFFREFLYKNKSPNTMQTGNMVAASSPFFRFSPVASATLPTRTGPAVAPRSPANARKANMAVPPVGHFWEDKLMVPGHMIPTARPQSAHPDSPNIAQLESDATK